MRQTFQFSLLTLILAFGSSLTSVTNAQYYDGDDDDSYYEDRGDVTYQTFYDELSPYGRWIDYPGYGYVWVPDAGKDFRPYSSNGHWVWTDDYEWMWVSEYDWGWAPFHYGRWDYDSYYGWYWVPGYEWSPAWVAWRDGGDYYGWAPLRPGIQISINFNIGTYRPPYDFWCFAPRRYIAYRNVYNYCVPRSRNITIINHTTIINNYNYRGNVWRTGPRRVDVEVYAGRIHPVRFRSTTSPGRRIYRNNEVNFYRPQVRRNDEGRFAPRNFERFDRRDNDNRVGRTNNEFRRNNERVNRNNDNRDYNTPDRRFDRRNDNNNNRRYNRTERNNNNNRDLNQPRRTEDRRIRPLQEQQRNTTTNNDNRRFERLTFENRNNNTPVRQQQVRDNQRPRREVQRNNQPRQFERRNDQANRQDGNRNGNGNGRFRRN